MAGNRMGFLKARATVAGVSLETYLELRAAGLRVCTVCKRWLWENGFGKDRSRADGVACTCWDCRRSPDPYAGLKGRPSTFKGKKHTAAARAKMSAARIGNKNNWQGGISPQNEIERGSRETAAWKLAVFKRDHFTCQDCGTAGGELNAHHLKPWATHRELRHVLENGVTLCKTCHGIRHGRKTKCKPR